MGLLEVLNRVRRNLTSDGESLEFLGDGEDPHPKVLPCKIYKVRLQELVPQEMGVVFQPKTS